MDKWQRYYQRGTPPWESGRPSSQLAAFMTSCPARHVQPSSRLGPGPQQQPPLDLPPQFEAPLSSVGLHLLHACPACEGLRLPLAAQCLELGCGSGASLIFLALLLPEARVVGVDLVPAAVAAARAAAAAAGVASRAAFVQADAWQLPHGFNFSVAKDWELQQAGAAAHASDHHQQQQQQQQQERGDLAAEAAEGAEEPLPSCSGTGGFDFVYDCQTYHVLREQDEPGLVALLHRMLRPRGLLLLLTGNDREPAVGPNVLSKAQLRAALAEPQFRWLWLQPSRFDPTPHYMDVLGKQPLAWWGLLQKL